MGKCPEQKRANLTTSMYQASPCITSANVPLVVLRVEEDPEEGPARAQGTVCLQGRGKNKAMIYVTTNSDLMLSIYKKKCLPLTR